MCGATSPIPSWNEPNVESQPRWSYLERTPTSATLSSNLLTLGRDLRDAGMKIGSGQIINLVEAVSTIDCRRRDDFYSAAKSTLVTSPEQIPVFDHAFSRFWRRLLKPEMPNDELFDRHEFDMPPAPSDESEQAQASKKQAADKNSTVKKERAVVAVEDTDDQNAEDQQDLDALPEDVIVFSAREVLKKKDFAQFTPDEIAEARRIIAGMNWRLGTRQTRRKEKANNGDFIDYRRTLRHSMKHGGVPIELRRRRNKVKMRPLVLICDISGSMDRYSRLLLQFVHAMEQGLENVEVFVFSTRLTRITRELRKKNVDAAIEQVVNSVHDWSGGTRIGESIKAFNYEWSRRVLRSGATVVMISDGWDRGDPQLLATEMARLQRSCRRLIWLNPLLGAPGYQPLTQGIRAALPFVDAFLPIHNLKSLEALAELLSDVEDTPPVRANRSIQPASADSYALKPFVTARGHLAVNIGPMVDGKPLNQGGRRRERTAARH